MSNGVKVLVSGLSHDVCKKDLLKFFHKKVKIIAMDNGKAFVVSLQLSKYYFQHVEWFKNIYIGLVEWEKGILKGFSGDLALLQKYC